MTIQMIEEGIKENDMAKVAKGFNSITGKNLVAPSKKNDNACLEDVFKKVLAINNELEGVLKVLSLGDSVEDNQEVVAEDSSDEEVEESEEDINEEEKPEEVGVEDDEEEVDEFAIDEDGNKYRVMAEESEEKEIFGKNRIKTKFVTNEPTEKELAQNKKIKVKKKKNNPVKTRDCIDCGEKTTNTYTRKGQKLSVCVKCENKRIGGGDK